MEYEYMAVEIADHSSELAHDSNEIADYSNELAPKFLEMNTI